MGGCSKARRCSPAGALLPLALLLAAALAARETSAETTKDVLVRGKRQTLRLYGTEAGRPVVLSSGDGGWIHLGPETAEWLARQGYFVLGVDSRAYLSSFTSGDKTLSTSDVPTDYRVFVDAARAGRERQVLLVGVSLGAGLSVLAASRADVQASLAGVVALGLPDENELGWHLRDSLIYLTKKTPREPLFRTADFISRLPPVPLAGVHSTRDEFVPLDEARRLFALPGSPKRLWVVEAENHRFTGNTSGFRAALAQALAWVAAERSEGPARP